jgi:hypothetical protein
LPIEDLLIADCRSILLIADWYCRLPIGIADCRLVLPIVAWLPERQSTVQSATVNADRHSTIKTSAIGSRRSPLT